MRRLITVFLVALLFAAPSPSPARQDSIASVRAAIQTANAAFSRAFARQDPRAVAAMYSSDAVVLPPDSMPVRGRSAIQAFWKSTMDSGVKSVRLNTTDVGVSDTIAYETGRVTLRIQSRDQQPTSVAAKYLVVWKREGRSWKIHRDIWNGLPK